MKKGKEEKQVKCRVLKKAGKKVKAVKTAALTIMMTTMLSVNAYAAGGADVMTGINNFKTFFLSVISVIGIIFTAKSVMDFSSALRNQDGGSLPSAVLGIIGGLITAFIGGILAILGLS